MNTIAFPNLGLEFNVNHTAFTVFGLPIAWYAIIIAAGFLLAVTYALTRVKKYGLDEDRVMDVIIAGMIGGIIGARLYFVAFSWDLYKDNWLDIFNTRLGGLAIYGGLIGALLVGGIFCKIRKVKILPMFDIAVLGFLIGQGIGRWGNFINGEAFGSETNSLFAMTISSVGSKAVHPCFLYESVWCLLGFLLLHLYSKRRRFDGEMVLLYCIWYGLGRGVIEGLRTDSLMWGPFRVSQMLSILLCVAALVVWIIIHSRIRRNNDPDYLKLYVYTEESAQMLREAEERRQRKGKKGAFAAETAAVTDETETQDEDALATDELEETDTEESDSNQEDDSQEKTEE